MNLKQILPDLRFTSLGQLSHYLEQNKAIKGYSSYKTDDGVIMAVTFKDAEEPVKYVIEDDKNYWLRPLESK